MKMAQLGLLLLFIILGFTCCGGGDASENTTTPPELQFTIDPTLLGDWFRQEEYGITLRPPQGWELVSEDVLQQLGEQVTKSISAQSLSLTPIAIFFNQDPGCLLSIAHITAKAKHADQELDVVTTYQEFLTSTFTPDQVKKGEFLKDGLHVVQFLIQDQGGVVFKLLIRNVNDQVLEFDYIVPEQIYSSFVKAIESSIGTIKLLD